MELSQRILNWRNNLAAKFTPSNQDRNATMVNRSLLKEYRARTHSIRSKIAELQRNAEEICQSLNQRLKSIDQDIATASVLAAQKLNNLQQFQTHAHKVKLPSISWTLYCWVLLFAVSLNGLSGILKYGNNGQTLESPNIAKGTVDKRGGRPAIPIGSNEKVRNEISNASAQIKTEAQKSKNEGIKNWFAPYDKLGADKRHSRFFVTNTKAVNSAKCDLAANGTRKAEFAKGRL